MTPALIGGGAAFGFLALLVVLFWVTVVLPDRGRAKEARGPGIPRATPLTTRSGIQGTPCTSPEHSGRTPSLGTPR
jgi:hypothetical protein